MDYCVVGVEDLDIVCNFRVTTMSESSEEMKLTGEACRDPDHSLLFWDVQLDSVGCKEKAESRGTDACTPDDFCGISVVSAAYKAMCKVVQMRLEEFVDRR